MPVTLDPDAAAVFKAFQEAGRPPYEKLSAAEARAYYLAGRPVTNPEPPELASVTPLAIPAPHGAIPARIYTPKTPRQAGGGICRGALPTRKARCRPTVRLRKRRSASGPCMNTRR